MTDTATRATLALQPDPHPLDVPGHPQTPDGKRLYDASCWMCREITAQPPPPATPKTAES